MKKGTHSSQSQLRRYCPLVYSWRQHQKYVITRRLWRRRKNGSVCAPSLNRPLDQNGNVVLDHIVYLSLRIAHHAKYSDLVLAVSCRLEHARFELTHRLECRFKENLCAMIVKETTITVLCSFSRFADGGVVIADEHTHHS